ncbi:MAG: outer membrane protein [Micropepsaceae bacterium]
MKTKLTLLASTTLAVLALSAPAQAAGGGWYVNLSGGANWLSDEGFSQVTTGADTLTVSPDPDTGWIISGAVGISLNNMVQGLRVEAEVAYRMNQVQGIWASTAVVADAGTLDYDHSTLSVLANVWYDFDLGNVRPYIGGGIGWAETELDGQYIGGGLPIIDVSDNGFAWQLGAGVNFDISPNVQLGLGYRYFEGPEVTIAAPLAINGASGEVESQNHAAVVSLTFGM